MLRKRTKQKQTFKQRGETMVRTSLLQSFQACCGFIDTDPSESRISHCFSVYSPGWKQEDVYVLRSWASEASRWVSWAARFGLRLFIMSKSLFPSLLLTFSKNWSTHHFLCYLSSKDEVRSLNEVPAFYTQSSFDQGTRYSNYAQLKGLQKHQSGKTEQKVRIKSSSLSDPLLTSTRTETSPWWHPSREKTSQGSPIDLESAGSEVLFLCTTGWQNTFQEDINMGQILQWFNHLALFSGNSQAKIVWGIRVFLLL